jgi:hypothetical protein
VTTPAGGGQADQGTPPGPAAHALLADPGHEEDVVVGPQRDQEHKGPQVTSKMTITITAVTDSRAAANPENTLAKSATYPAGPVTDPPSPPVSAWAMDRSSSTRG